MSKYLITGGEGFIGSKIASVTNGASFDLKSSLNILDESQLEKASENIEGIFHCAAKISVPESMIYPDEYYGTNVLGTKNVLNMAEKIKSKIVFCSSAAVYGDIGKIATEEMELNPKSHYAENKIEGENLLKSSTQPHVALRYFNVYGPGQSAEYAGVITFFILNALKGEDLVIYGDGKQVRDFVYVDDIVRANILAMKYNNETFEVFNIGSGVETSITELAEMIIKLTNSSSRIVYKEARQGDIIYSQSDSSKAKNIMGWQAKVSLEDGLKETISYYRNRLL